MNVTDDRTTAATDAGDHEIDRTDSEAVIEARGVTKRFDGDGGGVLSGIDLDVRNGETTVLMGPNGVGKTVLLACLAGGLHPSAGEIRVFGKQPSFAGAQLSFMLQNALAIPELSGRENLEYYADLHPAATGEWRAIAERLDLADDLDRKVRDYSSGMVRKLELAATLSVDVPLYLLDEPTAALDLTTVDRFHALLEERADDGATVVMTSHTPRDARAADRVVFVADGRIVADDGSEALLDGVPPIVRTTARADIEKVRELVRTGRFFEGDAGRRGFLGPDVEAERAAADDGIHIEEPSWTDLFNYYAHVVSDERT
ncbi:MULTISPECIES: ABC transporter ATP-binding protein [Halococcus]|uniref:ABC-type transport system ATP-binding protein n=1 Tax=Halococcus salifodinae DSM 8989 TaxID=1227456 RepID=M0N792_9EURY|nr:MULTISPECIES: ABC transporter ATP-binding protein [Halococcus]EMA53428.1 ABC-type transport system ATP-binding protein [Halococcus salifodinae DSM 8989]